MKKRAQIHKVAIIDIQSRDQIMASYKGRAKRCSHVLEVMLKVGNSKDVVIDVIQDLIADH